MSLIEEDKGRRHYARVPFSTRIIVMYSDSADGSEDDYKHEVDVTGSSTNLSIKGLFVKTQEKVASQVACKVKIILSGGLEPIELIIQARVARVEADGMGIVFDAMDLDTYTHLKNIVQYNSEDD
ncbi:MAG: PilZ domain-containing protein [Desulfamplus sp.]|nr:PilZ domain-containing protein [Desulfamplus sp.]